MKKKFIVISLITFAIILIAYLLLSPNNSISAVDFVESDGDGKTQIYEKYDITNYQIDYYVDTSWNWLPWNWGEGIAEGISTMTSEVTGFIWTFSRYFSDFTGALISAVFKLEFLSDMSAQIGDNIQTIAGINENGMTTDGLYFKLLIWAITIIGLYITYTGIIKKEVSKAFNALLTFLGVLIISGSFIAYAPKHMENILEFETDINNEILEVGNKILLTDNQTVTSDNTDVMRNALFEIQIFQPWLLLQYGTNNISDIEDGTQRIDDLLTVEPSADLDGWNSEDREKIVKEEVTKHNNSWMTYGRVRERFANSVVISIVNLFISGSIIILMGMKVFAQVLLIMYLLLLPVALVLSLFPKLESIGKRMIAKCFHQLLVNSLMTLIVIIALSISSMLYSLTATYSFLMIGFIQIVIYVGMVLNIRNIFSIFNLNAGESDTMNRRAMRPIQRSGRMLTNIFFWSKFRRLANRRSGQKNNAFKPNKQKNNSNVQNSQARNKSSEEGNKKRNNTSNNQNKGNDDKNDVRTVKRRNPFSRNNQEQTLDEQYRIENEKIREQQKQYTWKNSRAESTRQQRINEEKL